jgi:hypothetical protein
VRVSVGLEDVDDLIRDLDAAFRAAGRRAEVAAGREANGAVS